MNKNEEIELTTSKELVLTDEQRVEIEKSFDPKTIEFEGYKKVYEALLSKELSEEACIEFEELRKKLVKVRTGYDAVHKTQKAFFLAAGKFVDALKNKNNLPVIQMEELCFEKSQHFVLIEKEKREKIRIARIELLKDFEDINPEFYDLANMDNDMFRKLLQDQTDLRAFKLQKAKDEKAKEDLAIAKTALEEKRRSETIKISDFIPDYETIIFADLKEGEFILLVRAAFKMQAEEKKRLADIEAENLRLKIEAENKEKVLTARNIELKPYIIFIRDYSVMLGMQENEYQAELAEIKKGAEDHYKYETEQNLKKQAEEKLEAEAKEKATKEKSESEAKIAALQKEAADKKAAELKVAEDLIVEQMAKELADKKAAKAPLKERLNLWVDQMNTNTPQVIEDNLTVIDINNRFNAFKKLAKEEIEKI